MNSLRKILAHLFIAIGIIGVIMAVIGAIGGLVSGWTEVAFTLELGFLSGDVTWLALTVIGVLIAVVSFVIAAWAHPETFKQFSKRATSAWKNVIDSASDLVAATIPSWAWLAAGAVILLLIASRSDSEPTSTVTVMRDSAQRS